MIRYLLILVVVGCIAYPWARLSTPQTADAITSIYLAAALAGFALTMAIRLRQRRPGEAEPPEPAEEWVQKVHRIPGRHWEPGQD